MQQYYMDSSQNAAIEQALKLADKPYKMEFKGVYVMSVEKTSNFFGKLSVGDTVTKSRREKLSKYRSIYGLCKSQKLDKQSKSVI